MRQLGLFVLLAVQKSCSWEYLWPFYTMRTPTPYTNPQHRRWLARRDTDSVQQATEAHWLRRARDFKCAEPSKSRPPSYMPATLWPVRYIIITRDRFILTLVFNRAPNVVVEWLTLLLCTREVPGSNLGSDTGFPDWVFLWFYTVPPRRLRDSAGTGQDRFLPHPFLFIIHLSFHSTR
jgi:hypothetical protein